LRILADHFLFKRVDLPANAADGERVRAARHPWDKDIVPSTALRQWFWTQAGQMGRLPHKISDKIDG
jgi:uncharacterized protein YeaO (DUF488 family)